MVGVVEKTLKYSDRPNKAAPAYCRNQEQKIENLVAKIDDMKNFIWSLRDEKNVDEIHEFFLENRHLDDYVEALKKEAVEEFKSGLPVQTIDGNCYMVIAM